MGKGLPSGIVKRYGISKDAWKVFRDRNKKTYKGRGPSKTSVKKVSRRYRRKRRRRRTRTIPVLPIAGFAASTNAWGAWGNFAAGDFGSGLEKVFAGWTGYSFKQGDFDFARMAHGLLPIALGVLVHKGLNFLGVNRVFSGLPSPFNRVRL